MRTVLFILAIFFALFLISRGEDKPSVVPIEFAGRSTYRHCADTAPLFGKWEAGVSHGYFSDEPDEGIDFVEITLELPQGGNNVLVPFQAAYSLSDLPQDILTKGTKDLVSFDEESHTLTFDLGTVKITVPIPRN